MKAKTASKLGWTITILQAVVLVGFGILAARFFLLAMPKKVDFRTGHALYKLDDPHRGEGWIEVHVARGNGLIDFPVERRMLTRELLTAVPVTGATLKDTELRGLMDQSGRTAMVWRVYFDYQQGGAR